MRRAAKVDSNQSEIVELLRAIEGCSVQPLHTVGDGCPDLLVGYRGFNFLFEVKDPANPDKRRHELTDDQKRFHATWRGQVRKVFGIAEIVDVITGRYDEQLVQKMGATCGQA